MFRPAFACAQHPKAGRNTQQWGVLLLHYKSVLKMFSLIKLNMLRLLSVGMNKLQLQWKNVLIFALISYSPKKSLNRIGLVQAIMKETEK